MERTEISSRMNFPPGCTIAKLRFSLFSLKKVLLLAGWARWSASLKKIRFDLKLPIVPGNVGSASIFSCAEVASFASLYEFTFFFFFLDFLNFFVQLYRIIGEVVLGKKMRFFSFGAHAVVTRKRLKTSLA